MMKLLLLSALVAPFTLGCGSDDSDGNGSSDPVWQGTYLLEIPETAWTEPAGLGADIGAFVTEFILNVEGTSATDYTVTVGLSRDGVQDTCSKTVAMDATASPPDITIGPSDYEIYLPSSPNAPEELSIVASISDFTLTNLLPDGDMTAEEGVLSAQADARDLYPLFYQIINATADSVCAAVENEETNTACEPCSDGEAYCLTMVARGLGATPYSGSFETVDESCPPMLPEEE